MRSVGLATCTAALLAVGACGGSSDPGPRPLSHHFDDMHIAAVPLGEKQPIIQAQNDYSVAKMEYAKAKSDYSESGTKLTVAKNERKQALLSEQSASSEKKAADKSADMTRVNQAASAMRAAQLHRRAADEKVSYLKYRRKYLKKVLRWREEDMYAKEAKFEWEKARLARSKNIRPKGVDFGKYESQQKKRSERSQRAKAIANKSKSKMEAKKKKWEGLKASANRASGMSDGSGSGTGTESAGGDGAGGGI